MGRVFIRTVVAYNISALVAWKGLTLENATKEVIKKKLIKLSGDGGIAAMDKEDNINMEFNTAAMYRASINTKGKLTIGICEK